MENTTLIDVTPRMTGATTPSPYSVKSSESYSGYYPWKLFDKNLKSDWCCVSGAKEPYIIFDFATQTKVSRIEITNPTTGYSNPSVIQVSPTEIEVLGSNDEETWTSIIKTKCSFVKEAETLGYDFNSVVKYRYYKLVILSFNNIYYSALGEIKYLLDPVLDKKFLIYDNDSYKTIIDNNLEVVTDLENFTKLDMKILPNFIDQLSDIFKIIEIVDETPLEPPKLKINIKPKSQIIKQKIDVNLSYIESINKIDIITANSDGKLRIGFSFDSGNTWKSFSDNKFNTIQLENLSSQGNSKDEVSIIPSENWNLENTNKTIRFAYYLESGEGEQPNNIGVDKIQVTADMLGSWKRAMHGKDYDYEYSSNTALIVNILTDGTYKINYGDFNISPDGSTQPSDLNITQFKIKENEFKLNEDELYVYRWNHNKKRKAAILNAMESLTGEMMFLSYTIVDENNIDLLLNKVCDVDIAALI